MEDITPVPIPHAKRVFDLAVSALVLVFTAPLWAFFLLAIALEHILRGYPFDPLLYREIRISAGKPFWLIKFNIFDQRVIDALRTNGEFVHTKRLERSGHTIFVGKILRQIYLDELPQLINVLMGDMSLVGPRPINEEIFALDYQRLIPAQALVRAGMTGLAQTYKQERQEDAKKLDAEYVRQCRTRSGPSLVMYDVGILYKTIKMMMLAKGV